MRPPAASLAAAALAGLLGVQLLAGHLAWRGALAFERPAVVSGDEPHYLAAVSSLLRGERLELRDAYERARAGGLDLGAAFAGKLVDHHSIVRDREGRAWALWQDAYDVNGRAPCRTATRCSPFPSRLPFADGAVVEYPAHPPAFSALIAAPLALLRTPPAEVEHRALILVMLVSWVGLAALALLAWQIGTPWAAAVAAAALAGVASPWLAYGRSFFAETAIGTALVLALLALHRGHAVLAGLALVAAAALKPNFALLGGAVVLERLWARDRRGTIALMAVLGAGGLALMAFNWRLAGTLVVGGREPWRWAEGLEPLGDTLFSDEHGLLAFAPWVLLPLVALVRSQPSREPPADARAALLRQIALMAAVHLAVLAANRNGEGWCYGPRYWVPLLPLLALAAVETVRLRSRWSRGALAGLAAVSLAIALPAAVRYADAFAKRPFALWLSGQGRSNDRR